MAIAEHAATIKPIADQTSGSIQGGRTIEVIGGVSSTIVAATQSQADLAREITENVHQRPVASQDVAANINQVRVSSSDNQQVAAGVFGNSRTIAAEVSQVSKHVAAFIEKIRAA